MNEINDSVAARTAEYRRTYIEALLSEYPATTEDERQAILDFLRKASALDTALLTCNETISEKLKAFRHDNREQLGFTLGNWVNLAILLGFVALAIYYFWDAGI